MYNKDAFLRPIRKGLSLWMQPHGEYTNSSED